MKRGTPDHPKTLELQVRLGCNLATAVGVLELLWHWCASYAPQGDVGRWPDGAIAAGLRWDGDAGQLVGALVGAGWLDERDDCRLYVHDWHDHADDGVHSKLFRAGKLFADGTAPSGKRLSREERERAKGAKRKRSRAGARPAPAERASAPAGRTSGAQPSLGRSLGRSLAEPEPAPGSDNAPPAPPARDQVDQAEDGGDDVGALDRLSTEVARLRSVLTGKPASAEAELRAVSRTPTGAQFGRPADGTPAWRRATLDRLLAVRDQLRAELQREGLKPDGPPRVMLEADAAPPDSHDAAVRDWDLILGQVEKAVGAHTFATWFRPTNGWAHEAGGLLRVEVPAGQFALWLAGNFGAVVEEAARAAGLTCRIGYAVREQRALGVL